MRNIWTGKKQKSGSFPVFLLVFAAAAAIILGGLRASESAESEYKLRSVRDSISRAAALCYAAEGSYPESLEYLSANYGVKVNTEKYTVHYSYAGGNIPPDVIVTEKKSP